ncbi:MAG: hypothetical protein ABI222_10075 [Opitutaceae bacterium]
MSADHIPFVAYDLATGAPLDFNPLDGNHDVERRVRAGELTRAQADELLQAAGRRRTAELGPDLGSDPGEVTTEGGFGTGQGMVSQSTRHGNAS